LADGRTALSQHRRRSRSARRSSRRPGFLLPVTAVAVIAITGTSVTGYLAVRTHHSSVGSALALALAPEGHAMAVLEQQRQQLIVMDATAKTVHLVGSPKLAARPSAPPAGGTAGGGTGTGGAGGGAPPVNAPPPNPGTAQSTAYKMMSSFGFNPKTQFSCLNNIWTRESGWRWNAENASGAYGIPQALPGSKMATAGSDWQTNPATQIKWGLGYIQGRYGTTCNAWAFWEGHSYY